MVVESHLLFGGVRLGPEIKGRIWELKEGGSHGHNVTHDSVGNASRRISVDLTDFILPQKLIFHNVAEEVSD